MSTLRRLVTAFNASPSKQAKIPAKPEARADGKKFLKAFGPKGGVWFAEGKSFAEATALHVAGLQAESKQLEAEQKELKRQLARGQDHLKNCLGDTGMVRFAKVIKLPGTRNK